MRVGLDKGAHGLNILCSIDSKRTMTIPDVKSAFHRFWSTGIDRLIMLAPACFDQRVLTYAAEKIGPELALVSNLNAAVYRPIPG